MLCLGRPHHPCLDKPSTHPGTPKIQDWHAFKFEEGSAPALKAATKCLAVLAVKAVGDIAAGWHKKRRMVWLKSFTHWFIGTNKQLFSNLKELISQTFRIPLNHAFILTFLREWGFYVRGVDRVSACCQQNEHLPPRFDSPI
jgi:hypothetical protein